MSQSIKKWTKEPTEDEITQRMNDLGLRQFTEHEFTNPNTGAVQSYRIVDALSKLVARNQLFEELNPWTAPAPFTKQNMPGPINLQNDGTIEIVCKIENGWIHGATLHPARPNFDYFSECPSKKRSMTYTHTVWMRSL